MGKMDIKKCDKKGRLYLTRDVRTRYGERFVVVTTLDGVKLIPVADDPVEDMARLGKTIKADSIRELKDTIRGAALAEAGG